MTHSRPCFPGRNRRYLPLLIAACLLSIGAHAQSELPDAPASSLAQQQPSSPQQQNQAPESAPQPSAQTTQETKEEQQRRAEEELKKEEKQRILGVVPNFGTTDIQNAAPLTPKEKLNLDLHSTLDPFTFVAAFLDAGLDEAQDSFPGYGHGPTGYFKNFGSSYADTFDGGLWGNALLPIALHEDPRYFRRGTGSFMSRFLYSASTTVWCKRDNGRWGPNYANVGGNFIAGGISNLYYPAANRGAELTVTRAITVTAEGAIGSEFVEFWPDISRHLFHKTERLSPGTHTPPESSKPVEQPARSAPAPQPNPPR